MSITNKISVWLAASGLLLITTLASSGAYAALIDGITEPSLPQFKHTVKIRSNNGTWTGSRSNGTKDLTFRASPSLSYTGELFKFNLTANFDSSGNFVAAGSTMSIQGSIAALGITDKKTVLMSADLTAYAWGGDNTINLVNNALVGFNTAHIYCDPGLGVFCTDAESIILTFATTYGGDPLTRFNATANAVTSVPIPAAVWLFGSGLGLMGVIARRRKQIVTT